MPKAKTQAQRQARNANLRTDRAGGATMRTLAKRYGLALSTVHRIVSHVRMARLNAWHTARSPKESPLPPVCDVSRYYLPRTTERNHPHD